MAADLGRRSNSASTWPDLGSRREDLAGARKREELRPRRHVRLCVGQGQVLPGHCGLGMGAFPELHLAVRNGRASRGLSSATAHWGRTHGRPAEIDCWEKKATTSWVGAASQLPGFHVEKPQALLF